MKLVAKKAIVWSTVGTVGAAAVVLPIALTPILSNYKTMTNSRELGSKTMGSIIEQIVATNQPRKPNKEVYKSEPGRTLLIDKYKEAGFKYPAYNFRYNEKNNSKLIVTEGGVQKEINCAKAIHEEEKFSYTSESLSAVEPNVNTRWSTEGFVLDEIHHNRLKKHPAIEKMYRDMISDDIPSVTKRFIMPTTILGTNETGLYIPPGELATIEFSDELYEVIQKNQWIPFKITLNINAWDGKVDNPGKPNENFPMGGRYPFISTDFGFWEGWKKTLPKDPNDPNKRIFPKTFKFGSPFGGIINIYTRNKVTKELNGIKKPLNLDFKISGAIPTLHYVDGVTTEQEWNAMVDEVISKKRAPFLTANTFFYSFGFPLSGNDNQPDVVLADDKNLKTFTFPQKTFRKWFDFLFSSWYFSSGDRNNHSKINMRFSDPSDIWGGAAAWGGGDALSAPIGWAVGGFLSDVEDWSWPDNWGTFHEINHNFQQDTAFFRAHEHPETNTVSMTALTQLNDKNRGRTEFDPYSDKQPWGNWWRLGNYFGLIDGMNKNVWHGIEYAYYANLLYTFGPYNFMNYVRYDVANHWNSLDTWTGQGELINLSKYFKLNLINATYDYLNKNFWPDLKNDVKIPTQEEMAEIKKINQEYKSVDFVGNLYAAGSYIYNNDTNDYYYGGDSSPSFTIPFGEEYVFDMKTNTQAIRKDISWSGIEISNQSANGAKLIQDPHDPFKIKYVPNLNNIKQVGLEDEFDVSLIVNPEYVKKYNSIPKYKWKIKVRQETNAPMIEYFEEYSKRDFKDSLALIDNYDKGIGDELKLVKKVPYMTTQLREFLNPNTTKHELSRIKFKFVVPETREYNISFKCDDQIRFKIHNIDTNEKLDYQHPWYRGQWTYIKDAVDAPDTAIRKFNWKKGEIVDFDIVCVNTNGGGNYELRIEKKDQETGDRVYVNYFKNALIPNIFEINDKYFGLKTVSEFLTNIKYAYEFRKLDYSRLPFINGVFLGLGEELSYSNIDKVDINNFDIYYQWPDAKPEQAGKNENLKDDNTVWEDWNLKGRPAIFYFNFKSPQNLSGINIKHRTSNWTNERPTKIKITDITNQNQILFDGEYKNRQDAETLVNFNKKANNTSLIKVELVNEKEGSSKCLSLMSIIPYKNEYLDIRLSNSFAYNDPKILYSGKWEIYQNEIDGYQSNMNNGYIKSGKRSDNKIEFNVIGNGFSIVGPVGPKHNAVFDVYINDKLYKSNLTNVAQDFDPNANLCYYLTESLKPEKLNVKVVIKKGSLIFNYLNTYGNYSNLYIENKKTSK